MAKVEIKGTVEHVGEVEEIVSKKTDKTYEKRLLVVTEAGDGDWPESTPIEFFGDKVDLLAGVKVGDPVEVFGYTKGRPWNDKWFLSINAARISVAAPTSQQEQGELPKSYSDDFDDLEDPPF